MVLLNGVECKVNIFRCPGKPNPLGPVLEQNYGWLCLTKRSSELPLVSNQAGHVPDQNYGARAVLDRAQWDPSSAQPSGSCVGPKLWRIVLDQAQWAPSFAQPRGSCTGPELRRALLDQAQWAHSCAHPTVSGSLSGPHQAFITQKLVSPNY